MSNEQAKARRRAFLALGAGAILGGCVQGGAPGGGGTGEATATRSESPTAMANSRTETTPTNRPETEPTNADPGSVIIGINSNKSEPQTTETIGDGTTGDEFDDEDGIMVWNDADTVRRISVTVEQEAASGGPLLRETYRFEPDAYITIDVLEAGEYAVTVGIVGDDPETVGFAVDDCNDQSLFITVTEDGAIQSNGISTMQACNMVTVATENDN